MRSIRSVSQRLPCSNERESLLTIDGVQALVQLESAQRIVDIVLQADFHAPDRLGDSLEGSEVDHHEVVDRQSAERLHGLQHAPRASIDHGLVEAPLVAVDGRPVFGAVRQHHQGVSGDADADGLRAVSVTWKIMVVSLRSMSPNFFKLP